MEKAIVNMTDWNLYVYDGKYNLSGIADVHPNLGRNVYISHTSSLKQHAFENNILTYETSNTIYICPLKYMTVKPYQNVVPEYKKKLARLDEHSDSILDKIIAATAKIALLADEAEDVICLDISNDEMVKKIRSLQEIGQQEIAIFREQEEKRLLDIVQHYENSIYLEVSNVEAGDWLAYHLDESIGIVTPYLHTGMFQDSVLYMKYAGKDDSCSLDFRYFPKGFGTVMQTYSWSDNIGQAVIKNVGNFVLIFNNCEVQPGETKVFTPSTHRQGLISPDCHNGKSIFSDFSDI